MMNHVYKERFPKVCRLQQRHCIWLFFQFERMYCPTLTKQSVIVNPPEKNIVDIVKFPETQQVSFESNKLPQAAKNSLGQQHMIPPTEILWSFGAGRIKIQITGPLKCLNVMGLMDAAWIQIHTHSFRLYFELSHAHIT